MNDEQREAQIKELQQDLTRVHSSIARKAIWEEMRYLINTRSSNQVRQMEMRIGKGME